MPDVVDNLMERLRAAAAAELERIGSEMVEDFRQRTGETYPPPSDPGTPPHQRTGNYREGFELSVTTFDEQDAVQMDVANRTVLARWLEYGTVKMAPRQHFQPVFDDWRQEAGPRLKSAVQSA